MASKEEMDNKPVKVQDEIVAIDLPAPTGWSKKFLPKNGGTPKRNEIVFVSPTGEKIVNKRQLEQYLKSHSGSPSVSEFDWGTGDTPRRSARISEKSKATETPELEQPKKVQKKSSSKKGKKEKEDNSDGEGAADEVREAVAEETEVSAEEEMKDAEDAGDDSMGELDTEEALVGKDTMNDSEKKTEIKTDERNMEKLGNVEEAVTEETKVSAEVEMKDAEGAGNDKKGESDADEALAGKDTVNDSENKTEIKIDEPKNPLQVSSVSTEAANPTQDEETVKNVEAKVSEESVVGKVGEDQPDKDPIEEVANAEAKKENGGTKEGQDAEKTLENHSLSCKEAPHEPKASTANC